jgi:hypothetical protein
MQIAAETKLGRLTLKPVKANKTFWLLVHHWLPLGAALKTQNASSVTALSYFPST